MPVGAGGRGTVGAAGADGYRRRGQVAQNARECSVKTVLFEPQRSHHPTSLWWLG